MSDFGFRYHIGKGDVGGALIYYDNKTNTTATQEYKFTHADGSTPIGQAFFEVFEGLDPGQSIDIDGLVFSKSKNGKALKISVKGNPKNKRLASLQELLKRNKQLPKDWAKRKLKPYDYETFPGIIHILLTGKEKDSSKREAFRGALATLDYLQNQFGAKAKLNKEELTLFFKLLIDGKTPKEAAKTVVEKVRERIKPKTPEKPALLPEKLATDAAARTHKDTLDRFLALHGYKVATTVKDNAIFLEVDGEKYNLNEIDAKEMAALQKAGVEINAELLAIIQGGMKLGGVAGDTVISAKDLAEYIDTLEWYKDSHPGITLDQAAQIYAKSSTFKVVGKDVHENTFIALKDGQFKALYEKIDKKRPVTVSDCLAQIKNKALKEMLEQYLTGHLKMKLTEQVKNEASLDKFLRQLISMADVTTLDSKLQEEFFGIKADKQIPAFPAEFSAANIVAWVDDKPMAKAAASVVAARATRTRAPKATQIDWPKPGKEYNVEHPLVALRATLFEMNEEDGAEKSFKPVLRNPDNGQLGQRAKYDAAEHKLILNFNELKYRTTIVEQTNRFDAAMKQLDVIIADKNAPERVSVAAMQWKLLFLQTQVKNISAQTEFSSKYKESLSELNQVLKMIDSRVKGVENRMLKIRLENATAQLRAEIVENLLVNIYYNVVDLKFNSYQIQDLKNYVNSYLDVISDTARFKLPRREGNRRIEGQTEELSAANFKREIRDKEFGTHPTLLHVRYKLFIKQGQGAEVYTLDKSKAGIIQEEIKRLDALVTAFGPGVSDKVRAQALVLKMYVLYFQIAEASPRDVAKLEKEMIAAYSKVERLYKSQSARDTFWITVIDQALAMTFTAAIKLGRRVKGLTSKEAKTKLSDSGKRMIAAIRPFVGKDRGTVGLVYTGEAQGSKVQSAVFKVNADKMSKTPTKLIDWFNKSMKDRTLSFDRSSIVFLEGIFNN